MVGQQLAVPALAPHPQGRPMPLPALAACLTPPTHPLLVGQPQLLALLPHLLQAQQQALQALPLALPLPPLLSPQAPQTLGKACSPQRMAQVSTAA